MGRSPCCSKEGLNKGAWVALEDELLTSYIQAHGEGKWRNLPKRAGLKRCGKSCRLRWLNYLRPDIKRGNISHDEEELIIRLHNLLGNRWSLIAGRLPGRTDNEIKNYWNTILGKRAKAQPSSIETPPTKSTHKMLPTEARADEPDWARKAKIEVIRTRATRCSSSKVMVPILQPPAGQDIDGSNLFELRADDQLCLTNNQEMCNGAILDGSQAIDSFYTDGGSDFLNLEINDLPLPFDEAMFKDWTTNPLLNDNIAATDLDTLASWLDNDEWP